MSFRSTAFWGAGLSVVINANTFNFNLLTKLTSEFGYTGAAPALVRCLVLPGVTIGSTSPSSPAFTVSGFPARSSIILINEGTIQGCGGAGGPSGGANPSTGPFSPGPGAAGGDALLISVPIILDNRNGNIWSGGGGAGGAGPNVDLYSGSGPYFLTNPAGGGGGAAGTNAGTGGSGNNGYNGSAGTALAGGTGGQAPGLPGGNGGMPGSYGTAGANGFYNDHVAAGGIFNFVIYGAQGGAPGRAINLSGQSGSAITWLGGNNGIQVKGIIQ